MNMDNVKKIKDLKENLSNLKQLIEDLGEHHISKKDKITKLHNEKNDLKKRIYEYIDEIQEIINKK